MADHKKPLQLFATKFSDQEPLLETFLPYLSQAEFTSSFQKITVALKNHSILSFGLRRKCLGGVLNISPERLNFIEVANSKPALQSSTYHFNVSHSEDYWVMCVQEGSPVGVDIEFIHRSTETLDLARRFFHPEEVQYIESDPELFWEFWTAKEAILKAMGEGIVYGLHQINLKRNVHEEMIYPGWKLIRREIFPKTLLMIAVEN